MLLTLNSNKVFILKTYYTFNVNNGIIFENINEGKEGMRLKNEK